MNNGQFTPSGDPELSRRAKATGLSESVSVMSSDDLVTSNGDIVGSVTLVSVDDELYYITSVASHTGEHLVNIDGATEPGDDEFAMKFAVEAFQGRYG